MANTMPDNLVLVRHGRSHGNEVVERAKGGDLSGYTEEFMTTPGLDWHLVDLGWKQLACTGAWLQDEIYDHHYRAGQCPTRGRFDFFYVSTAIRAIESAAAMALDLGHHRWRQNRSLRERDWGDIGAIPRVVFEREFPRSAAMKKIDPLYWCAPGGESMAQLIDDRVRNVLDTMARENEGQSGIIVGHGELIRGFQMALERITDARFREMEHDADEKIHNGEAVHYTRLDPKTGELAGRLRWVRRAWPVEQPGGKMVMTVTPWREIVYPEFDNDELLAYARAIPQMTLPPAGVSADAAVPSLDPKEALRDVQ